MLFQMDFPFGWDLTLSFQSACREQQNCFVIEWRKYYKKARCFIQINKWLRFYRRITRKLAVFFNNMFLLLKVNSFSPRLVSD